MTPLPDILPIQPFTKPVHGLGVLVPGSKSLTNRALLIAALCNKSITLTDALFSDDTLIMAEALRRLGLLVTENEAKKTILVKGQSGKIPNESAELFVGNAGTAARFLTALCASAPSGVFKIDGVPQMRKRPMKGLFDALRAQGAKITCTGEDGFFPITIQSHGLQGGKVVIDASESSQMLSALLLVAPLAKQDLKIALTGGVRWPFVQMTANLMKEVLAAGNPPIWRRRNPLGYRWQAIYFRRQHSLDLPDRARRHVCKLFPRAATGHDRQPAFASAEYSFRRAAR